MSINKGQTCQDQETDGILRVFVVIEPWEPWMAAEIELQARDHTDRTNINHMVEPTGLPGGFLLKIDHSAEVKEIFESGNAEVRVVGRKEQVLGSRRIAEYRGSSAIALKMRIVRPAIDRFPMRRAEASNVIISETTIHRLARNLAKLQGVGIRAARAPRAIVRAIDELNRISEVAAYSRTGDKRAEASLRSILSAAAFNSPGGPAGRIGGGFAGGGGGGEIGAGIGASMLDALGELQNAGRCGPGLSRAAGVLDSAFTLDMKERNADAKWTRQAHVYVNNRMQEVSAYVGSVGRAPHGTVPPGGDFPPGGGGFPPGDDDFTTPVLLPDPGSDFDPPVDPLGEGFGSDFCAQIAELCLALYAEVLDAQVRDTYTDLIAVVEPNCLCSTYDTNQTFIARPQPGRFFDAPLRSDVVLCFRGQIITPNPPTPNTPNPVTPQEIHFKIPANAETGFVFLRALGPLPAQASQRLTNSCSLAMPEIPSGILFNRSPAALISIIYPPVIASLTSDAGQQPAEACTPVEIRWHVHLLDQPPSAPIHPCGSIHAILRDGQGNQIAAGGATGTILETRADTMTYTLEADSRAAGVPCGTAAPISLTIVRVKYVRLERPAGLGTEHQGGTNGQFLVRISCPALPGGQQVDLTSSDPAVLQVPSPVTILEGQNSVVVDFVTTPACTAAPIRVNAASAGHTAAGSLECDIYNVPVVQWAAGPPAHVQEGGPFSSEVNANCVPDNSSRVNWWLIRTDPNNQQPPITLMAQRTSGQYPAVRFRVELGSAAARGLIPGNWELVVEIPDRANVRSQGLAFVVSERPRFTMALTSPAQRTVVWDEETEYTLVVTGANLPPAANAPVALTAQGLPSAFQVTPVPATLTHANNGQAQNAALRVLSPAFRGPIGVFPFTISASASGVQAPPAIRADLVVKRALGPFKVVTMEYNSTTCSNSGRSINATVGGNGKTRTVTFDIPTPNRAISSTRPAVFYSMSPKCRVGVVIPPVTVGNGPTAVELLNLGFEPGTGVRAALGDAIDNFQSFWQRFWFGSDDTLLVIIGRQPRGLPTATHFASLYDMITGQQLDSKTFAPAILQTAEDPSPLFPADWKTATPYAIDARVTQSALVYRCLVAHTSGDFADDLADGKWDEELHGETEIQLAEITGIDLINQNMTDVVRVSFRNQNEADTITLRL